MKPDANGLSCRTDRAVAEFTWCGIEDRSATVRAESRVVAETGHKGARLNDDILLDLFDFLRGRGKFIACTVRADDRGRHVNNLVDMFWNWPVPRRMSYRRTSLLLLLDLWLGRFGLFVFAGFELLAMQCLELRFELIAFPCYLGIFGTELFVIFLQFADLIIKPPLFREYGERPLGRNAVHVWTGTLVETVELIGSLAIIQ